LNVKGLGIEKDHAAIGIIEIRIEMSQQERNTWTGTEITGTIETIEITGTTEKEIESGKETGKEIESGIEGM